jgi:nucleoside 2-deoxyribosyltransferase
MDKPLWYIATPYSRWPKGIEDAFIEAAKASAELMKRGMHVYSPICHSHPIAMHGKMDALSHEVWMNLDFAMIDACDGVFVVMMPGWDESTGIRMEIEYALKTGKPVTYLSWPMLSEREHHVSNREHA